MMSLADALARILSTPVRRVSMGSIASNWNGPPIRAAEPRHCQAGARLSALGSPPFARIVGHSESGAERIGRLAIKRQYQQPAIGSDIKSHALMHHGHAGFLQRVDGEDLFRHVPFTAIG